MQKKYFNEFKIIAIHSNDFDTLAKWFSRQEPLVDDLIHFSYVFQLNFDIFKTVSVNGDNAHPLFKYLKSRLGEFLGSSIKWNFSKFLIHKNGTPFKRFSPFVNPLEIENDIILLLKK